MKSSRGGKIILYQDLYTRYSRLQFSRDQDRPVAIAGLEKRLIHSLNIKGGFGVLDDKGNGLLRRSLLWHRAADQPRLEKITFHQAPGLASTVPNPPTWSWMAYKGAIEYLDLPFDQIEWEERELVSPWLSSAMRTWSYSRDSSVGPLGLRVFTRRFDVEKALATGDGARMMLDTPGAVDELALECVVLGRQKSPGQESWKDKFHFVLLVTFEALQDELHGPWVYKRAGAGYMPGSFIRWDREGNWGEVR